MVSDSDEGFTVRDRRRFHADDEAAVVPPAESAAAAPAAEPAVAAPEPPAEELTGAGVFFAGAEGDFPPGMEMDGPGGEGAALPDIYSVLALFLQELRGLAWLRMGLIANPATGAVERDLEQARVAIDTVAFLAAQLEQVVAPEERLPLKALVSDLQVNFVEQAKRS